MQKVPEPFIETEASLAVVIDEYDPMRPNEYEVVQQKFREDKENERSERGERSERSDRVERSRDRDYDKDRDRYGKTAWDKNWAMKMLSVRVIFQPEGYLNWVLLVPKILPNLIARLTCLQYSPS